MGATGTGKTKLAIEVAKAIEAATSQRCEIINADVMQCYAGCPVVTNKATAEEQASIPHHLMGFADPCQDMKMPEYRAAAERLLGEMKTKGSLPLIVGGSDYYVKSLISRTFDPSKAAQEEEEEKKQKQKQLGEIENEPSSSSSKGFSFKDLSDEGAYSKLREIDPVSATRLHPNNTRRIRRYLEMYETTGVAPSVIFKKQRRETKRQGALLYNCLVFFLDAEDEALKPHLRSRVDGMVLRGMVEELAHLYESKATTKGEKSKATDHGIFQAIGVKEFRDAFLSTTEGAARALSPRGGTTQRAEGIARALEEVKRNTIKLAKKQRRRMLTWMSDQEIAYRAIDMTAFIQSKSQSQERENIWKEHLANAMQHVSQWMQGGASGGAEQSSHQQERGEGEEEDNSLELLDMKEWRAWKCEICRGKTLRGPTEWQAHLKSRGHRKRRANLRKRNKDLRTEEHEDRKNNTVVLKIVNTD
jgi:tRNA dimethylallyltransferase